MNKAQPKLQTQVPPQSQCELLPLRGYQVGEQIDTIYQDLLSKYPINPKNVRQWLNLLRHVETTTDLLQQRCKETIKNCGLERTIDTFSKGD